MDMTEVPVEDVQRYLFEQEMAVSGQKRMEVMA